MDKQRSVNQNNRHAKASSIGHEPDSHVVLKSAQLLLEEEVEEEVCPGAGGVVVTAGWAEVGVAEAAARRLMGASLSGILSA